MRKIVGLFIVSVFLLSSVIYADTYTLDEILPSIASLSDDDLQTLIDTATAEQGNREPAVESIAEIPEEPVDNETPITEREDYVERTAVKRGDTNDDARLIQERLIELGYLAGTADGNFGAKSEAATLVFQKANGLDETGVADSITQYILFSDNAVNKEMFDSRPLYTGEGWEVTKEFYYESYWDHYYMFVLKNTSGYNADISVNVVFYDAQDNIIGVDNDSENDCENGYETFWSFSNEEEFDHVSFEVNMSQESYYLDGSQSSIELSYNIVGDKAIITAKNIGFDTVSFLEYHVLFLNDNNEVVSTGWGYLTDDDSEIKPGATIMKDETSYEPFSNVMVYAHGRISKY